MKLIDLTGQRFERVVVIARAENRNTGAARWLCRCDCGIEKVFCASDLKSGRIKSCGCLKKERCTELGKKKKHGLKGTKLYNTWGNMKYRCYSTSCKEYPYYGGRGIKVCEEWRADPTAFYEWAIKNGYRDGLSIDRIDVNGDYSPDNCRWADSITQANNKRYNVMLSIDGQTKTVAEWAREVGIAHDTLRKRLDAGWPANEAVYGKTRSYHAERRMQK